MNLQKAVSLVALCLLSFGITNALGVSGRTKAENISALLGTLTLRPDDSIYVIVNLQLERPWVSEVTLAQSDPARIQTQRADVRRAQLKVLALIGASETGSTHLFDLPSFAVEVNASQLRILNALPEVSNVRENRRGGPALYSSTSQIGAVQAWTQQHTGAGQIVVVIDAGVQSDHPFLNSKVIHEACYSSSTSGSPAYNSICTYSSTSQGSAAPCASSGAICDHGTHVAGIAAGKAGSFNGSVFNGVAPDADIIAIQVYSVLNGSTTTFQWFESSLIDALRHTYAIRNSFPNKSIAAVNMSLYWGPDSASGPWHYYAGDCDSLSSDLVTAIGDLVAVGIPVVIAAGNDGMPGLGFPACITGATAVAAVNKSDLLADFTNNGPNTALFAPGAGDVMGTPSLRPEGVLASPSLLGIVSSAKNSSYKAYRGTSMATPHVAGAFAVLRQMNPSITISQMISDLSNGPLVFDKRANAPATPKRRLSLDASFDSDAILPVPINSTTVLPVPF